MVCGPTLLPSALSKTTVYEVDCACGWLSMALPGSDAEVASLKDGGASGRVGVLAEMSVCWPVVASSRLTDRGGAALAVVSAATRLPMIMLAGRMTMAFKRPTTMADREDTSGWHMIGSNPSPKTRRSDDENPKFFIGCMPGTFPAARKTLACRVRTKWEQHPDKSGKKCYVKSGMWQLPAKGANKRGWLRCVGGVRSHPVGPDRRYLGLDTIRTYLLE